MYKFAASRGAGSLTLEDTDEALTFEATLAPEMRSVGYVVDFLGTLGAGLVGGISPGFRVTQGGDYVKRDSDGLMRVVRSAGGGGARAAPARPRPEPGRRQGDPGSVMGEGPTDHRDAEVGRRHT